MKAFLLVSLGGAFGAVSRWLVSAAVDKINFRLTNQLTVAPLGTLTVNCAGSFLIGAVFGAAAAKGMLTDSVRFFAVAGFLGSFTTFSTFSYHTFEMLKSGHHFHAVANVVLNVVLTILFVLVGYFLGSKIVHASV